MFFRRNFCIVKCLRVYVAYKAIVCANNLWIATGNKCNFKHAKPKIECTINMLKQIGNQFMKKEKIGNFVETSERIKWYNYGSTEMFR